jgi:integrase
MMADLRAVFGWYAERADDDYNPPLNRIAKRASGDPRERLLSDDEIRRVWHAAEAADDAFGRFVMFLLASGARRSEASGLLWDEIIEGGTVWHLPARRNKSGRDFDRPLSSLARAVLTKQPRTGPFVFGGDKPLGNFTHQKRRLDAASGVRGWRLHDTRRVVRSALSRCGVRSDIGEMAIGHIMPGTIRRVYDRYDHARELAHAVESLATLLRQIIDPTENVITMRR